MIAKKPSVYVLPLVVQSHLNPMLQFSKRLALNTNLSVTFFIPTNSKKPTPNLPPNTSIAFEFIPDGSDETQEPQDNGKLFGRLEEVVSRHVYKFIMEQKDSSYFSPKLLVYDSIFPWGLDIAHQLGLLGASFFMMCCSMSIIFHHIKQGLLSFPFEDQVEVELPLLPKLEANDLPAMEVTSLSHALLKLLIDQFSNLEKADFVLFNSFDELEIEVCTKKVHTFVSIKKNIRDLSSNFIFTIYVGYMRHS